MTGSLDRLPPRSRAVRWVVACLLAAAAPLDAQVLEAGSAERVGAYPIDVENAPRPVARAAPAMEPVTVDGRLDDAAWRAAEPVTRFIQSQPATGHPSTEPTIVRILYDARNLYIGAFLHDTEPVTVMSLEQDYETHDSDVFGVTLDPYLDRRNSFMFLVNPRGAIKDGQTFNDSRDINLAWEGVVHVETMVTDSGWTVEMAIPFTTLRFDPTRDEQRWGLQLLRRVRRRNEDAYWAPVSRRDRVHKMSRAGTLVGLDRLRRGRNLQLKPYAKLGASDGELRPADERGAERGVGLDLKYGLTPGLTLDLTYNTDFAQVEVDQEQVNLTRFSLFFPEQREFFIENSGVFTFGDVTERNYRMGSSLRDFTLFHSRRIGLSDGRPLSILGGGRLTGRVGGFQLGLLDMQVDATAAAPAENFFVGRVRRDLFDGSDVGVMFVNRQGTASGGDYSRSWGADANVRLFGNMIVNSYLAGTEAPGADGAGRAGRVSVAWRDRLWDASAFVKRVGADFDPGVGFVRRRGIREYYGTVGVHPLVRWRGIDEVNPYVELDYVADGSDALETREGALGVAVDFRDGGNLEVKALDRYERLDGPFEIYPAVTIPAGAYAFREASASYRSSGGRALSGNVRVAAGDFYDGTKRSLGVGGAWRASPRLSLDLALDRNAVELPGGAFDADAASARVVYALSRKLFASGFVQYATFGDQLTTNVRLNYIHAPLSDVFLVYVERRDVVSGTVLERTLAAKVTNLFSF